MMQNNKVKQKGDCIPKEVSGEKDYVNRINGKGPPKNDAKKQYFGKSKAGRGQR